MIDTFSYQPFVSSAIAKLFMRASTCVTTRVRRARVSKSVFASTLRTFVRGKRSYSYTHDLLQRGGSYN